MPASPAVSRLDRTLGFCETRIVWIYLIYALVFLFVAAIVPIIHDYRAYLVQWQIVVDGRDPWRTPVDLGVNAYGPLHNLYGLLFLVGPKVPRLLGAVLWLAAIWPIVVRILQSAGEPGARLGLLLAAVLLNPFLWGWVAVFGSNDAFVAVFLVAAVLGLERRASVTAGAFVALAALMKFYPLLVIPFVAFDRRRLDLPFAATAIGLFVLGMAGAMAIWGASVFTPLLFAANREASQLSIYAFLSTSPLSPLQGVDVPKHVSQGIFALAGASVFLIHVWRRGRNLDGMVLGLLTILAAYQLGHFQFYLPLMLIIPLYIVLAEPDAAVARWLMAVVVTVSVFATCYLAFGGLVAPPWLFIRQNSGLPTVAVDAVAIVTLLRRRREDNGSSLAL